MGLTFTKTFKPQVILSEGDVLRNLYQVPSLQSTTVFCNAYLILNLFNNRTQLLKVLNQEDLDFNKECDTLHKLNQENSLITMTTSRLGNTMHWYIN